MKTIVAFLMIVFSVTTIVVLHAPPVAKLRGYPIATLQQEASALQMKLDASKMEGVNVKTTEINQARQEILFYQAELLRRNFLLEWIAIFFGVAGILYFVVTAALRFQSVESKHSVRVQEAVPNEVYADEQDFFRQREGLYQTREEALTWFENDPLRICNYCGADAVYPIVNEINQIQHLTFFKKVPSGARDQRIVLGSYWTVLPARNLQCVRCKHGVSR